MGKAVVGTLLAISLGAAGAGAQECTDGRISEIRIERQNVFDVEEISEDDFLHWVLQLGNTIHIRTSESYVRGELLFEDGDCYDPFLLSETARILRGRDFIKWAEITTQRQTGGDVSVLVRTQDDWSLSVGLGLSFDEGLNLEGLTVTESNFLGRGSKVGLISKRSREIRETGLDIGATRLFGTPWTFSGMGGDTRVGTFLDETLSYPFNSELDRLAVRQSATVRDDFFPYSVSDGSGPSHVLLPYRREVIDLTAAGRWGTPGHLWLLGGGISREVLDPSDGLDDLRVVVDGDFDDLGLAGADQQAALTAQTAPHSATRVNLLLGFRRVGFTVREALDAVEAPQDVKVGTEATITLGRTIGAFSGADDADDLYGRVNLFAAVAPGAWVFSGDAQVEGRHVFEDGSGTAVDEWRDVLAEVNGRVYLRPEQLPGHTFFGRVSFVSAWSMDRPYQLTGGGREGVRGYSQDAFPGGRRILGTFEDRLTLMDGEAVDVGLALFGDLGRVWAEDVPYGEDSGWRSSLGVGFRVNMPSDALRTLRFDFTLPLSGDREAQGVYFRFYAELGGLLQISDRPTQVERSRWSGVSGDLTAQSVGR